MKDINTIMLNLVRMLALNTKEDISHPERWLLFITGKCTLTKWETAKKQSFYFPVWAVVLLSADFGPLMGRLSEKYTVFCVEYFCIGFSSQPQRARSCENYVEEIRTALKSVWVEALYALMPHSISSVYNEYYASKYPDEVQAILSPDGASTTLNASLKLQMSFYRKRGNN